MLTLSRSTPSRRRVLAVASGGGHWVQLMRLRPAFEGTDIHYATVDPSARAMVAPATVHLYPDANKDTLLRMVMAALALAVIVIRVRPHVVISTGAAGGSGLALALAASDPHRPSVGRADGVHRFHRQHPATVGLGPFGAARGRCGPVPMARRRCGDRG